MSEILNKLIHLWNQEDLRTYFIYPVLFLVVYMIYQKKFGFYVSIDNLPFPTARAHKRRGNPPPSYPNGWFRIASTFQLKPGDVKYIKLNGRHLALFRGEDKIAYALDAFCNHMGANLGIGGQVKWKSCIECPFHGWTFNGKDGVCVNSEKHDPKQINRFKYHDETFNSKGENGYLNEVEHKCVNKIGTYKLLEQDGEIYCWFHALNKEPFYFPPALNFSLDTTLQQRALTVEYINCHTQDIPENGADFKHFQYIHQYPSEITGKSLQFQWNPNTCFASDPKFMEKMGNHQNKKTREWQLKLFKNMFANKQNLPYINVLSLDSALSIFGLVSIHLVNATVFQIGSGTVYLFFKFPFFEQILIQSVVPSHQFCQQVSHKQYFTWWVPNWLTAFIIKVYLKQVNADQKVWNHKIFDTTVNYVNGDWKDEHLLKWRNWFSQYYEGCFEYQKKQNEMDW